MVKKYFWWKALIDHSLALLMLLLLFPFIFFLFIISSVDTHSFGVFFQKRVGKHGKLFTIYKLKTFHPVTKKVSVIGQFMRKYKLDELPQLFNILKGEMSFVGPRPDIPGYYDMLQGEDRKVLLLKPGLTSEASLKYRNEEYLLLQQENPLQYNDEIIFPDKVKMNLEYLDKFSFWEDCTIILNTIITMVKKK